ncbi:extracellular metalloprotease [Durotheca rogersii]|uniref:extracellular metalloprotease n=1 Tax=Durotheca rogersii TaxID=419775 RepID=UPI00221EA94D|nr:extracellular metalloprotease [Durotheca rogersii]KAI5863268.1 extracellular metalloprotease [Durotheca rogersii]
MSGHFINNPDVILPVPPPSNAAPILDQPLNTTKATTNESVVNGQDGRELVDIDDYRHADGKFRAIVKLFLLYEGQISGTVTEDEAAWAIATGWLVKGDIVVTAGHCAFDHSHGLGRLIKVKAYVGYNGREKVNSEGVEFRHGVAVATTEKWFNSESGHGPADVSFIKLSAPFTTVGKFFTWKQTPISQKGANLGVVGYPGDIANDKGERGAMMYKMFKKTDYELHGSYMNMLQYKIDTNGGNSGSPVLTDQDPHIAIGVHVLGGYSYNSASVINGPYGNRFKAYYDVADALGGASRPLDSSRPDKDKRPWLWTCHATTTETPEGDPVQVELMKTIKFAQSVHAKIEDTVIDADEPISFGPDAGPQMGILASAAIAAAGRLAADGAGGSSVEALANTRPYDGVLGRAILAEAALGCFFEMPQKDQDKFTEFLGPIVASLKPFVMGVAPKLLKGTLEPSMRLLLSNVSPGVSTKRKRTGRSTEAEKDTGFGRKLTEQESAFLNGLMDQVDDPTVESFFGTLTTIGDVIGSALKKAGPILKDVAKIGLPLLLGTEAGGLPPLPTHLDPLAHRAILAEACLEGFINMPQGKRIFKNIIDKVKVLGPKLMNATPFMVKYIGPVVADMLREIKEKEEAKAKS